MQETYWLKIAFVNSRTVLCKIIQEKVKKMGEVAGKIDVEAKEEVGAAKCGQEGESGRVWLAITSSQLGSTLLCKNTQVRSDVPQQSQPTASSDN